MKRRFVLIVFAVFMTLIVIGCGGNNGGNNPPNIPDDAKVLESVSINIPSSGGVLDLQGYAKVTIPSNAFANTQSITVSAITSTNISNNFIESAQLYQAEGNPATFVRITVGASLPATPLTVAIPIPTSLNTLSPDYKVRAFARIYQDGGEEILDNFELMPSTIDLTGQKINVELPPEVFTNLRNGNQNYECIVTLSSSPTFLPNPDDPQDFFASSSDTQVLFTAPLDNLKVTSPFGPRKHPITGAISQHKGTDFAAANGTPVYSVADGKVISISSQFNGKTGWGRYVMIQHGNRYTSLYAHLDSASVKVGDTVTRGQLIAKSDSSGGVTGPHLHMELTSGGTKVDPCKFFQSLTGGISVNPTGLIPKASKSIKVNIKGNNYSTEKIMTPQQLSLLFIRIPDGIYTVNAAAYPDTIGGGIAQAKGKSTVTVVKNQTSSVSVTMATTIVSMSGKAQQISTWLWKQTIIPLDAQGNQVIIAPENIRFTSSNTSVATVDNQGYVYFNSNYPSQPAGTKVYTTITGTDIESGVSYSLLYWIEWYLASSLNKSANPTIDIQTKSLAP